MSYMKRGKFVTERLKHQDSPLNPKNENEPKLSFNPIKWRSAALQILVKLKESTSSSSLLPSKDIINQTFLIMNNLISAFHGTGYDEVFQIISDIFFQSIYSDEKTFNSSTNEFTKIPFFEFYNTYKEQLRVEENNNKFNLYEKFKQNPNRIKTFEKQVQELKSSNDDLKYENICLKKKVDELESDKLREKNTTTRAFIELKNGLNIKTDIVCKLEKKIKFLSRFNNDDLGDINSNNKNKKLIIKDGEKGYSKINQVNIMNNMHKQMEIIENQRTHNFMKRFFDEKKNKRSEIKKVFVSNINLLTNNMNLLKHKVADIIKKDEELGNVEEFNEVYNIQEEKNRVYKRGTIYSPFEFLNPLNFNSMMEIHLKQKKNDSFTLLRRILVTERVKPVIIELPENSKVIKLSHFRYHNPGAGHSNIDDYLYNHETRITDGIKVEKPLEIPDGEFWDFYKKKYGEKSPNFSRNVTLYELRCLIEEFFLIEYKYQFVLDYEKSPSMIEILHIVVERLCIIPEVSMKVFYELLKGLEKYEGKYYDINNFYNCLRGKSDSSIGRCCSIFYHMCKRIWKSYNNEVDSSKIEDLLNKVYYQVGKNDIQIVLKEFFRFANSDTYNFDQVIDFFFLSLQKSTEYWCQKFVSFVIGKDEVFAIGKVEARCQLYYPEFEDLMQKISPETESIVVEYRFKEMVAISKGTQVNVLKLALMYTSVKIMKSLSKFDKEN